jgi:hypothetical protein
VSSALGWFIGAVAGTVVSTALFVFALHLRERVLSVVALLALAAFCLASLLLWRPLL